MDQQPFLKEKNNFEKKNRNESKLFSEKLYPTIIFFLKKKDIKFILI